MWLKTKDFIKGLTNWRNNITYINLYNWEVKGQMLIVLARDCRDEAGRKKGKHPNGIYRFHILCLFIN